MLSTSGAIFRFSWFISSSYSKSEIARSPLTIAFAPFPRANSTIRLLNGLIATFGTWLSSASRNSIRSSVEKRVFALRTGRLTTGAIPSSKIPPVREMMSKWPFVIGSYEPGQTAFPLKSGDTVELDAGVAVVAHALERQRQLARGSLGGLGDDAGVLVHHSGKPLGERQGQTLRRTIWGVQEGKIE